VNERTQSGPLVDVIRQECACSPPPELTSSFDETFGTLIVADTVTGVDRR
jgi:hypothetical protein